MSVQAADPYLVLELRRDASSDQIQRAYRKLAMRWHPDRNSTNIDTATERFSNVNESYDVLTNRRLRAILDKQGLVALSNEYKFTKSPQAMFEEFFGTLNPFSVLQERAKEGARQSTSGPPPLRKSLDCTLEELYVGCIRRPRVERVVVSSDGMVQTHEDVVVDVVLQPGYRANTEINFPRRGDVMPGMPPSDLVFVITELPHERFSRSGNDVHHVATITLAQALGRHELVLQHLDGRTLTIDASHILTPTSSLVVADEGFPGTNGTPRGNLVITFNIIFPEHLTTEEQETVSRVLSKKFRKK